MSLKASYKLIAPFYDLIIDKPLAKIRVNSLAPLGALSPRKVLINGIGTGLDIPYLAPQHEYYGLDLTRAMLKLSRARAGDQPVCLIEGNSLALPFPNTAFDIVVLHLIVAVVPSPLTCLQETARVLKPGGQVLLIDKFLRRGQRAWVRRLVTPVIARIVTRLDVVLEDILDQIPELKIETDVPVLAKGWFRQIRLTKV